MRKWHRWLSVLFGTFILFIAATGLLSHWAALWPEDPNAIAIVPEAKAHGDEVHTPRPAAPPTVGAASVTPAATEAFVCPDGWRCRPAPPTSGPRAWVGFFHHLHSGEEFGTAGTVISILSGLALVFFAISGLWMYARMWAERTRRSTKDRWFWK